MGIRSISKKYEFGFRPVTPILSGVEKTATGKQEYMTAKQDQIDARVRGEQVMTLPRGTRHRRWVGRVCIARDRYEGLRAEALGLATHRSTDYLRVWFYNQPFLPFAPVRLQLKTICREVNKSRRHVGYQPVADDSIRFFMTYVPAFDVRSKNSR